MKIGIFGGSFNPPHNMHREIAEELINKQYVDKIIFVPTGSKYKYKTNLISDKHRYKMLKIICKNNKKLEVSDYELKDQVVYTYQTLNYFKDKYKNDEIYFICGTDNLTYMDKWKNGIDILENNKILVIKRDTDDIKEILIRFYKYQDNILISDIEPKVLSSTMIREKIKNNDKDLSKYLDKDVYEYIKVNKLYLE